MRLPLHSGPPNRSNDSSPSSGYSDSRSNLNPSALPSVRTPDRYPPGGPRSPNHRSLPSIHNASYPPMSYSQAQLAPLNQQHVQQSIETAGYPPPLPPPPSSFDPRFASYHYPPADQASGHMHTRPVEFETVDVGEKSNKKRRGNLPKHTTDILRAWLHDHLEHAYPNEEQKQRLIQQTGLSKSRPPFVSSSD